jgi:hypothetical protein
MKPLPAPPVPGNTEAERFENAVLKTFTVSKEEIQRREVEWQKAQWNEYMNLLHHLCRVSSLRQPFPVGSDWWTSAP